MTASRKRYQESIEREITEWWEKHTRRMGFSESWAPSYNVKKNGPIILEWFPRIGGDDFCWLCNQLARAIKSVHDTCLDNWRFCQGPHQSADYAEKRSQGCCGFYDELVTNPKTGSLFWIGFNYGH